jgi:DNA-binding HxlR family transcriptional regulator
MLGPWPTSRLSPTLWCVLHRTYSDQDCSVARALEVVGERWTILILRDAFLGVRRFDDFQRSLGVARNVLQTRLRRLVDEGLLERRAYQERPVRHEYCLTPRGEDLWPVLLALMEWGDRHRTAGETAPRALHRGCGGPLTQRCACTACEAEIGVADVELRYERAGTHAA